MSEFDVGATIGSAGDLGIEFSSIEVDALNFEEAAVRLNELAGYIAEVDPPLRGAKAIARDDMRERFNTQIAPDGSDWEALDPEYAARKQYEVGEKPILTRDSHLRKAATSEGAWSVAGDSLFFNTSSLPIYWRKHQLGGEAKTIHFAEGEGVKASDETFEGLPARPFIGLSAEAEAKILTLFDIWFSEGIDLASKRFAISGVGTLQARGPKGFGPRIHF